MNKSMVLKHHDGIFCLPCGIPRGYSAWCLQWHYERRQTCSACGRGIDPLGKPIAPRRRSKGMANGDP